MSKKIMLMLALLAAAAMPAIAANLDGASLGDKPEENISAAADRDQPTIAVVLAGDYGETQNRLNMLGYEFDLIATDSDLNTLENYELVILPRRHAGSHWHTPYIEEHAADYLAYVEAGGGLFLREPNPYWDAPPATITWVPYDLVISPYRSTEGAWDDCSVVINTGHCITTGYPYNTDIGFPSDTVVEMGPEWTVLARGGTTQSPSTMVAEYGQGKILVELSDGQIGCTLDVEYVFRRMIECTRGVSAPDSPPTCDAGGPYPGDAGSPIQFDGTGSFDTDGTIVSYAWDFGDGSTGTGPTPTHTYTEDGEYMVSLCVTDDEGLESCCQSEPVVATEAHSWSAVKSLYR